MDSYRMEETHLRSRVNLLLPLDVSIQIEKESEKRGIQRAQFIKEAIHEKLKKSETKDVIAEIQNLKEETREIKYLTLSILEKIQRDNQCGEKN